MQVQGFLVPVAPITCPGTILTRGEVKCRMLLLPGLGPAMHTAPSGSGFSKSKLMDAYPREISCGAGIHCYNIYVGSLKNSVGVHS